MPAKILEAARGMAWHFWPALPPTDTLLVPAPAPAAFLNYLADLGLRPPRFATEPTASSRFTPFGWNAEALRRNMSYTRPSPAPDPAVVSKVNARAFSLVKEKENFGSAACPANFFRSPENLKKWLETASPGRYVAKGNHSLAGIGQLRVEIPDFSPNLAFFQENKPQAAGRESSFSLHRSAEDLPFFTVLNRLMARMDGLVLEEEQKVSAEFGVLFRLGKNGSISTIRIHHLLSGIEGNFLGALAPRKGEADPILDPWRNFIEESVARIAAVLCGEGYFGPVGVDMYVWEKDGRKFFRPLVDLNARCSMAWPVHGLAQCFQGSTVMIAHFPAARIFVPRDYDDMHRAANKLMLDPKTNRGFIWLTPLLALTRHSLAFVGSDATDVMNVRNMTLELLALKGKI
ncbi:MAG: hypothetical protein K0Q91_1312 [Fibrobacteria bacterium]|nr:hypothetical protein [Fibrobacteria bacterium]